MASKRIIKELRDLQRDPPNSSMNPLREVGPRSMPWDKNLGLLPPPAKPVIESGDVKGLLDPNLEGKFDEAQLQRMVLAAYLCITRAARLRPKLSQILKILKGDEKVEYFFNSDGDGYEHLENQESIDDEVYPNSSAELHLNLALLGIDEDDTTSYSSTDHSNIEHSKERRR